MRTVAWRVPRARTCESRTATTELVPVLVWRKWEHSCSVWEPLALLTAWYRYEKAHRTQIDVTSLIVVDASVRLRPPNRRFARGSEAIISAAGGRWPGDPLGVARQIISAAQPEKAPSLHL
jgi:hypothetical protein